MKLNDTQIKNAKPKDKSYKLSDGGGLFLLVTNKGQKYWRMSYRFNGKQRTLAIGVYPQVSLKQARQARDDAKEWLAQGIDPSLKKKQDKLRNQEIHENTFEILAMSWHKIKSERWSKTHADRVLSRLQQRAFPFIGSIPIEHIEAPDILKLLRKIEADGLGETTYRVKNYIEQILTFAIAEGKLVRNPATGLEKALKPKPKVQHHAAFNESELPEFLRQLEDYRGHYQTQLALKFLMLTVVRTKELQYATWEQFDLDKKQWVIPAENMKMDEKHIVPLSYQALALLKELRQLNSKYQYVFAGISSPRKPMANNTLTNALYRMGYKGNATVHGFRATFSTMLNENGFNRDWIERQLAHGERDEVRAAYNHAQYLAERTKMMQWWADKIDNLRKQDNVIVANFGR